MKASKLVLVALCCLGCMAVQAQIQWKNIDSLYKPLPGTVQVFITEDSLDGAPNRAFYVRVDLRHSRLMVNVDTSDKRRLTPKAFYDRNAQPLIVMNTTFFNYQTNQSINPVVKNGKPVAYNLANVRFKSVNSYGDSIYKYRHYARAVIGFDKRNRADIGWAFSDTSLPKMMVMQSPVKPLVDEKFFTSIAYEKGTSNALVNGYLFPIDKRWLKYKTVIGGGPVLVQGGSIAITNNEESLFPGAAVKDKHPRTAIGYTPKNELILLVVEGRHKGVADGASLVQLAKMLMDLGCVEAMNFDGGGSSCLLINGKETIKVSDKEGQRPVPAVLLVENR
ncbi:MAG: phosphodiester glycosidase family protein [Bacteroidetes bacterium]|nr:MAG: phosphodiester glycosidase family protein [Bacteroidota bacterium]